MSTIFYFYFSSRKMGRDWRTEISKWNDWLKFLFCDVFFGDSRARAFWSSRRHTPKVISPSFCSRIEGYACDFFLEIIVRFEYFFLRSCVDNARRNFCTLMIRIRNEKLECRKEDLIPQNIRAFVFQSPTLRRQGCSYFRPPARAVVAAAVLAVSNPDRR